MSIQSPKWGPVYFPQGDQPCPCTDPRVTVAVPPKFFDDHANRACLGHAVEGFVRGGKLRVELCPADLAELASDAHHYASSVADYGPDYFGLCMSARATCNALRKYDAAVCLR
jgi:hypothetical protein